MPLVGDCLNIAFCDTTKTTDFSILSLIRIFMNKQSGLKDNHWACGWAVWCFTSRKFCNTHIRWWQFRRLLGDNFFSQISDVCKVSTTTHCGWTRAVIKKISTSVFRCLVCGIESKENITVFDFQKLKVFICVALQVLVWVLMIVSLKFFIKIFLNV